MPQIKALLFVGLVMTSGCAASRAEDVIIAGGAEVAVIGQEKISFSQLPDRVQLELAETERRAEIEEHQRQIELRRSQQKIIEARAGEFLDEAVLNREMQATGKSSDQLLKELVIPTVTDADVGAFYEKHKQQINQPFANVSARIQSMLSEQATAQAKRAYLDSLRAKYSAKLTVEPLRETVAPIGPERGAKKARVTIVEFSDFQCPFCGQMAPILSEILHHYPNDVRLVYRQLPLKDLHPNALSAADASICAQQQGKFWEMHDALFADQSALNPDDLVKTAERVKLNVPAFKACLISSQTAAAVKSDLIAGEDAGVTGTPGLFINGRYFDGAMTYDRLAAIIDDELRRQNIALPRG